MSPFAPITDDELRAAGFMHESGSTELRIDSGMEDDRDLTCYAVHAASRTPYLIQRLGVWEEIREPVSHVRWALTMPGWPEDVRQRLLYHPSLIPRALSAGLVGIRLWDILRYVPRDAWERLPHARGDAQTSALLRLTARYPEPMAAAVPVATVLPLTPTTDTGGSAGVALLLRERTPAAPAKRKRVRRPKASGSRKQPAAKHR
jgi:hypothetical protein